MTLISQIITDAYRELNLIGNTETPTTQETAEGLRLLNRYIESLFGNEAGDPLMDMLYGENANIDPSTYYNDFERFVESWYLPAGFRLKLNLASSDTIKLTPNPENGARFGVVDASNNLATNTLTLDGNGSLIEGATDLVLNTDGFSGEWFYRSDKANWQRYTGLLETDESPFPVEFDDLLIVALAMRLDPRNGSGINPLSLETFRRSQAKFRARYTQQKQRGLDPSLSYLEGQRRFRRGYSLEGEFERGSFFRW